MTIRATNWPAGMESSRWSVRADAGGHGVAVGVLRAERADLAEFEAPEGEVVLNIDADFELTGAVAKPPRAVGAFEVHGRSARLVMRSPGRVLIEGPGERLLVVAAESQRPVVPAGARVFAPGVHDAGEVTARGGETLWLERGAVVRGILRVEGDGVRIGGGGVLDVGGRSGPWRGRRSVLARNCRGLRIDGLTVINPPTWQVVLGACEDAELRDLRLLGQGLGTDGVDVVGSRRVRVSDCFIVNADDCFVVKAFRSTGADGGEFDGDVEDVCFERSTVGNYLGGSALEIGHELICPGVRGITFRDIDVLFVHNHGAVYGIHHADSARIEDVRFERIRVHHCYDKLVDIRVIRSMWSKGTRRGSVRGVRLTDCDWTTTQYNPGYTTSQIGGYDAEHLVEDVVFHDFRVDGRAITSVDEIDLFTRHVRGVRVE